jgi:saccharopine dehydrogenase-like NADP-dependent oxidoreductase
MEYIRVIMKGERKDRKVELTLDSVAHSNPDWNVSAGAINTGVPPSIIAQMIAKGQVKQKGVLPPEICINPQIFFAELEKRDIKVYHTLKEQVN